MKRKKGSTFVSALLVISLFFVLAISAMAGKATISLPENQVWVTAATTTRSGNYSYTLAGLDSVYPSNGIDLYRYAQSRLISSPDNVLISRDSSYLLSEGGASAYMYIKEGYLTIRNIRFQFRGNTSAAAEAVVTYDPK